MKKGRLLLFAVTNLDNEANNCDYEHAKLEHVRVCDHNPLPPFLSVGGRKKTFSLRETRWGPPACRLSVAPLLNYHIFPQKATPIPTGTGALLTVFVFCCIMTLPARVGEVLRYTVGGWHFPKREVMLMWQNRVLRIVWILICIAFMLYIFTITAR